MMKKANVVRKVSIKGEFSISVIGKDGAVKLQTGWIKNLVTNNGLDRMPVGAIGTYLWVGTGSASPAFTDSGLANFLASTSSFVTGSDTTTYAGAPNYEWTVAATFEFAQGAVVGNIAELGLGWTASTANTLATRALILDGAGDPTTISVTSEDKLQVSYRLIYYPSTVDATGTVDISGVNYPYTARAYRANTWSGRQLATRPFGTSFSTRLVYQNGVSIPPDIISGTSGTFQTLAAGSIVFSSYTAGNHYVDFTVTLTSSYGNFSGGIGAFAFVLGDGANSDAIGTFILFTTPIPKTNLYTLTLPFRISWGRA